MHPGAIRPADWLDRMRSVAWREVAVIGVPVLVVLALAAWVTGKAIHFAPPSTIRILSGPDGSGYRSAADRYQKIIERYGVKVEVLPSRGALDNLEKLATPSFKADVGFVQGGLSDGVDTSHLMSLGSLFAQPLMIYCRSNKPIDLLSELKGKRLAIGPEGTGGARWRSRSSRPTRWTPRRRCCSICRAPRRRARWSPGTSTPRS